MARLSWHGWLVIYWDRFSRTGSWTPDTVTYPSTNRARRRVTSLIETNAFKLSQTANHLRVSLKQVHVNYRISLLIFIIIIMKSISLYTTLHKRRCCQVYLKQLVNSFIFLHLCSTDFFGVVHLSPIHHLLLACKQPNVLWNLFGF